MSYSHSTLNIGGWYSLNSIALSYIIILFTSLSFCLDPLSVMYLISNSIGA